MTTESNKEPTLDDIIVPTEEPHPDHREHAKLPKHPDEEELDTRVENERAQVRQDQADR